MSALNDRDAPHAVHEIFRALVECSTTPPPEITRATYGDGENRAHEMIAALMQSWGFHTHVDAAANLWIDRSPSDVGTPAIVSGSHLDSVPSGGNYDGAAGVVAALLVMRRLVASKSSVPFRVVALRGEESAWFGQCYIGSKALFGKLTEADFARTRRIERTETLRDAMKWCGAKVSALNEPLVESKAIRAFVELHIEQGPVLEAEKRSVGIVSDIAGNVRHMVTIRGRADHSGTTPMNMRSDAVAAFASFIDGIQREASGTASPIVTTTGVIEVDRERQAVSRIADMIRFSLEWRSTSRVALMDFEAFVRARAEVVERLHHVSFEFDKATRTEPVALFGPLRNVLLRQAIEYSDDLRLMPSGAGHDAAIFSEHGIPTGMIFVRNKNGSHNPNEFMSIDDFLDGVDVLDRSVRALQTPDASP